MSIVFTWMDKNQSIENVANQNDLNVLELKIQEREGEIAIAELVVPVNVPLRYQCYALIRTDDRGGMEPLFYGRLSGLPTQLNEYTQRIELHAIPKDASVQLGEIVEELKASPCYHPLFIPTEYQSNAAEYLEGGTRLFCFDRISHRITLSDIFMGEQTIRFQDQILEGTLRMRLNDTPLSGVRVHLSCEWVQAAEGEINLMPSIQGKFPQGLISTLTPTALEKGWPQVGQLLGRSGYAVVRSHLRPMAPPSTGVLGHYPRMVSLPEGQCLQRHWFKGELTLQWQYRQKRREVVIIDLLHHNQLQLSSTKPKREIKLHLNEVDSQLKGATAATFFDTPAGSRAIDHGIRMAQSHLAYSSRACEVVFQVGLVEAMDLRLSHLVEVVHPSLPRGRVCGKPIGYCLERSFDRSIATIRLAVATGYGLKNECASGSRDMTMGAVEGLVNAEQLDTQDFLEFIAVHNTAEEQLSALKDRPDWVTEDEISFPPNHVTQVNLHLKDLRSNDVLERHYQVNLSPWSAPNQIGIE